jgi:hypothetical protein
MTDAAALPAVDGTHISQAYGEILGLYRRFLAVLGNQPFQEEGVRQIVLTKALEEFGRLRIWGEQTRAGLHPLSRGSLDDILRKDPDLMDVVITTLLKLKRQVQLGKYAKRCIAGSSDDV